MSTIRSLLSALALTVFSLSAFAQELPAKFDPPNFALRLAHKDVTLATALGRELGVPMQLADATLREMTAAMARGWADRDSRSFMLLELERAGVEIAVPAEQLRDVLAREA